jgi:hypothetical protein
MIKLTAKHFASVTKRHRSEFPVNTKPILNIAVQNSRCTRVEVVGSMKEFFSEFLKDKKVGKSVDDWESWYYTNKNGKQRIQDSTDVLLAYLNKMPLDHKVFTRDIAKAYVLDLVINKTHYGMSGEYHAIAAAAKYFKLPHRYSTAEEEKQGIDGWIGEYPVQVKPADSVQKHHVRNGADTDKTLVLTYEAKKDVCYIHNEEFVNV